MTELEFYRDRSKQRRATLASAKLCINGAKHGPATHGVRCPWCHAVHKFGAAIVLASATAPARPDGHRVQKQRQR